MGCSHKYFRGGHFYLPLIFKHWGVGSARFHIQKCLSSTCITHIIIQHLEKQFPLAEGLFKYVMTALPPALEASINEDDFDR